MSKIKFAICKHLSMHEDSWAGTISKVSEEVGMGRMFVEQAMKDLISQGEVSRCSDGSVPQYKAPGAAEGKYAGFNDKRLESPSISGTFEDDPNKKPLTPHEAV